MKLTNAQMDKMMSQVEPYLSRTDIIGYAAARNVRVLREAAREYIDIRDAKVHEYGTPLADDDGKPTGAVQIRFDSPNWPKFESDMSEFAAIEHDADIFKIDASKAIGALSGQEILDIEWMLEFDDEDA